MGSLKAHRTFLIVWGVLITVFAAYVNIRFHKNVPLEHKLEIWHPYYFNIVYATVAIIPAWLWNLSTARLYGGLASAIGRSIMFLSLGLTSWGIGNTIWFSANVRGIEAPYPYWSDIGYLGILPLFAIGLFALRKVLGLTTADMVRWSWIGIVIAVVSLYLDTPLLGGKGYLVASDASFDLATVTSCIYVASDVILMTLGLMLLLKAKNAAGGLFFTPALAIALSCVALYVGDNAFFARLFDGSYYNADVSDCLYAASLFLTNLGVYLFHSSYVKMYAGLDAAAERGRAT